ncbi:Gfo/Idh/MocA family oxidoreductase [Paragemmobacter straminiformis]|uniref:Gfo/Idh/MocA family oxidoreductase n=1 Tax=Paragemmobacter straminiformis TaxID=2045119 RepID=A0A842I7M7_9RHOB|nr:Gfo/Idh/MocA family oxidoreductase [Gemmobacter straminiformis]MBC2835074.1 Gfo/Idh/MocA family oxidoreductase [Gemmobacter straminiformis]
MTLSVGVIGLGVMGAEHLRLLREETGGARVVAVCDADADRAQALAQGAQVFSDPMALIAAQGVGAVVIASPDATHAGLALACIAAGKPALCEKPLAATAAEALRIVDAEVAGGRRLLQIGYMRRFDPAYAEMLAVRQAGGIGAPVLLHNIHRNAAAPDWFTGPMAVTNSFVHEIDISRWLLGSELASAIVHAAPGGDPLMVTMETDKGEIVSTEVFMNAHYGYHVHAQMVGREGTVEMAAPAVTLANRARQHGHGFPANWVPRFADAYRIQMRAWVNAVATDQPVGASAWDGYVATAVAEQVVTALQTGAKAQLFLGSRPALYT